MTRIKKIHYSWYMALIGGLLMFCMSAQNMTQAVFLPRVAESLHVSMGAISLPFSMVTISSIPLTPAFRKLYQKYPARRVTSFVVLAQCVSLSLLASTKSIWMIVVAGIFEGCTLAAYNNVLVSLLVERWFRDRGQFVYNVILFISMMGGVVFTPVASAITSAVSWRAAYLSLAAFNLVIMLPVVLLFFREDPEQIGLQAYEEANAAQSGAAQARPVWNAGLTARNAWRSKDFWLVGLYMIVFSYPMTMPNHLTKHLESVGFSGTVTAAAATAGMLGGLAGRVLLGVLSEKFSIKVTNTLYCVVGIAAAAALCLGSGIGATGAIAASFLLGMAVRATVVMYSMLRYKVFGASADYVGICANLSVLSHIAMATSSTVYGTIFDVTGSYNGGFVLIIGLLVMTAVLAFVILQGKRTEAEAQEIKP